MATQREISRAVASLQPTKGFEVTAEGVVTMTDGSSPPTDSAINAEILKTKHEENRIYPAIGDQLDNLYKDILASKVDATGEFAKAIKAVKDANPKS